MCMGVISILSILAISLGTNVDGIRMGLHYGIRHASVPRAFYAVLFVVSICAALMGGLTSERILLHTSNPWLGPTGSAILIAMGVWAVMQTFIKDFSITMPRPQHIGFNEVMLLMAGEAMADLSIGFGAGFIGLSAVIIAVSIGVSRVVCLFSANRIGYQLTSRQVSRGAELLSGILLIVVGLLH